MAQIVFLSHCFYSPLTYYILTESEKRPQVVMLGCKRRTPIFSDSAAINAVIVLYKICSCRVEEFASIVPRQPYRPVDRPQEVRLEFEAILLDVSRDVRKNQLWIHAKIKACVVANDCSPVRKFSIFLNI